MRRYSTTRGRQLTVYERLVELAAASRPGAWTFLHVLDPIDRRLLALTRGRLAVAIGAPVGLLETRGARTGRRQRVPVLYAVDADRLVLVASNGGRARDPAWVRNIRAQDRVRFLARRGGWRAYRARVATGAERSRVWALATDLYAGYDAYQRRTGGRQIPVVVLEPAAHRGIEMPPAT